MESFRSSDIECRIVTSAPRSALIQLYQDAGWWDAGFDAHPELLDQVVSGSALFAAAFREQVMIGMGRALSDLCSDAYIQDVTVRRSFRGQGIGRRIIQTLIDGLKEKGVDWIGLVGQPGTRKFYEDLGFQELMGHIPFRLKD
jgi:aralkylamine N-acetyltransferase